MIKKMFALASVTALTGLVTAVAASGCSSGGFYQSGLLPEGGEAGPTFEGGVTDARFDAPVKRDAALPPEEDGNIGATCPPSTPITVADIGLTWLAPGAPQSACSQTNLDALKALFAMNGGSAKYTDIEVALGATCSACAFTQVKGSRWGIIIKNGATVAADNSSGSCFAQVSGNACGKAAFELDACVDIACPVGDCVDTAKCTQKAVATTGPCRTFASTFKAACPAVGTECDNFLKTIMASCGGGPAGGLDASL